MMYIKNNQDLQFAYEMLKLFSGNTYKVDNPDKLAQCIINTKRAVRQYTHREVGYDRRIVKDYGIDGYVSLERLPADIRDEDEANFFFEQFMSYKYQPCAYDCTGQAMTNWFKVFPRNGGFYAYHSVSFDV